MNKNILNLVFTDNGKKKINNKINTFNDKLSLTKNLNKHIELKHYTLYQVNSLNNFLTHNYKQNILYNNNQLHENNIHQNLPRGSCNIHNTINIDIVDSCILIIDFDNLGGGTSFFIESILSKYKYHQTFLIARNYNNKIYFTVNDNYIIDQSFTNNDAITFLFNNKHKIEKIFVNHILNHSKHFINNLFNLNIHITTITHDLLLINNTYFMDFNSVHSFLKKKINKSIININKFDQIITQNIANLYIYDNFITNKNKIRISPLPDFKNSKDLITTLNSNIVVGIIGHISDVKGRNELIKIINFYKNTNIHIVVFGSANVTDYEYSYKSIEELNQLLILHKPNILIELSIWPETYSYTLSLAMITQLPILYLKKNGQSVIEERLSHYNKAYAFTSINHLNMLIYSKQQHYFYTIDPILYFNDFWDNYFITKKEKSVLKLTKQIPSYVIYFPQFHEIKENNISFYPEFSDITNLNLIQQQQMVETPLLKDFQLQKLNDYDYVKNKNILQKQIDIIDDYNISGLAIYYYWFSINTITNQNLIMENVIQQFFNNSIDMKNKKCFFIWANESWSSNPAFGKGNETIKTEYTKKNLKNLSDNLLSYFKHDTYLKINNKPVFQLHHPWEMSIEEINNLYNLLDTLCIKNNFNGIHFIVNSINDNYSNYINCSHHFNYKKSTSCFIKSNQIYLDYKDYIDNLKTENKIQTLVFNFDNRPRLFKPNKLNKSTICINNTEINKIMFIKKIINTKPDILLINSWNEWGEQMAIEPSQEYGYYYLNLLNKLLP
jgi:hypothetical protein